VKRLLALSLLALGSCNSQADVVLDAIENCTTLQASSVPIGCKPTAMDDGTPLFLFGFHASLDTSLVSMAIARVVGPICVREPVAIFYVRMTKNQPNETRTAVCTPEGGLKFVTEWSVEKVETKKRVD
jgi:hypothetical protein